MRNGKMTITWTLGVVCAVACLALGLAGVPAIAQTAVAPPPPAAPPSGATGGGSALMAAGLVLGLLIVLGAIVKFIDLKRRRDSDAVVLQARIADAFLRDPELANQPVTATAHAPLVSGSPVKIVLSGHVTQDDQRRTARRVADEEARRVRPDIEIEDHIAREADTIARAA
jgi:hypothetical protein